MRRRFCKAFDYFIFEWDDNKNASNLEKHGIAFEDVLPVFFRHDTLTKPHKIVGDEQRWKTLGIAYDTVVVFIGHLGYDDNSQREVICIITARKATPAEEREYYANR